MAVGTVNYNATTTLGLSLLKISQPSGHKIDELGFFKPGYLNQDLIPGQSHSTIGARGSHFTKWVILGTLFQAEIKPNLPRNGPMLAFFGLFLSDFMLFVFFSIPKTILIIN